jgi:hypothetical protein
VEAKIYDRNDVSNEMGRKEGKRGNRTSRGERMK